MLGIPTTVAQAARRNLKGPGVARRRVLAVALLSLVGAVGPSIGGFSADVSPQTTIDGFHDALLSAMKNARTLGVQGRFAQLEPVMARAFDLPRMTEIAAGEGWGQLSAEQRARLVTAFSRFEVAQYADWFDGFNGQVFRTVSVKPASDGTSIVSTTMSSGTRRDVRFDYAMRQGMGGWRIEDIRFNGWFSEIDRRRSEFTAVLQRRGVDTLVARLDAGTQSALSRPDNVDAPHVLDPRPEMWRVPLFPVQ